MTVKLSQMPLFCLTIPGTDKLSVKPTTVQKYQDVASRMMEYFGKDRYVESITRREYAAWHDWLATRGTRNVTVNSYRRRARAAWHRMSEMGLPVCDIEGITCDEPEERRGKAITDDQINRLLQVASIRDAAIILYTLSAGFRAQSIVRIKMRDTHIWQSDGGEWRIASRIPTEKTSPPRIVIGDEAAALACQTWLKTRQYDSPYLFSSYESEDPITLHTWKSLMQNIRKRANIPSYVNCSTHGLRHRFAQDKLGEHDEKIVAQWMGISVETMLTVYAHRDDHRLLSERFGDNDFPQDLLL
ncbi:MAG: site-specific integrase [Bacteroidetes bacterium]|nr:site-specific integrase [Bacteroidota bacterium]